MAVIDDVIWYNESGMRPDALVRFNPRSETFQSWAIPSGVGIIRNVWVTEAGDLLIHQSSSNQIGLVKVNSRWCDLITQGQHTKHRFNRARRAEQMAGHRLG